MTEPHGVPARATALDLLNAVLARKRPLDGVLETHPRFSRLVQRDRAFARNLVATVLRRLGEIDAVIDACLERPLPPKARGVRDVLRLGICQLLFFDTPPHAAVDTAVRLTLERNLDPYKALVNAVLRRSAREGKDLLDGLDADRLDTPDWLWESWSAAYGEAGCREIAAAHRAEPPLDVSVKVDPVLWSERLNARILPTGSLRLFPRGPIPDLPGYEDGQWWVQDTAASLPARLLGETGGRRVIDLCAAPGGKTAQLAAAGARVTAVDRSETRLRKLRDTLDRLRLEAEIVTADATRWKPPQPVDAVLIDAPCSATGTIRRHPDVAWLKRPQDVAALIELQDRLLNASLSMVKPGGLIVYCVCSLQPEEGPDRIARLLASGAPCERVPINPPEIGGIPELVTNTGDLRSLPNHLADTGGMDGFYAARLRHHPRRGR